MQIKSKLRSATYFSLSFLCNILKMKFYIILEWKMIMKVCFCEVFHYSNIELFRGNKTIQWQHGCQLSPRLSLISAHYHDYCTVVVIANQGIQVGH